jgi:7,8-dihydroneopterin aldolase/epimerase/oxygenase
MALIEIEGMEFHAFHGCHPQERLIGTKFKVWVSFSCNTSAAEQFDKITDTVNYQSVYEVVKREMITPSNLLEHLARRIIESILREFPTIEKVNIKVSKLHPAMGGSIEAVSVSLSN